MKAKKINTLSIQNPFLKPKLMEQRISQDIMGTNEVDLNKKETLRRHTFAKGVDDGDFVKVWVSNDIHFVYQALSINAKALLGCFILNAPMMNDVIGFSNESLMKQSGLGINNVRKALNELIKHRLIDRVSHSKKSKSFHMYYINADYFFKGMKSVYYKKVYEKKEYHEGLTKD